VECRWSILLTPFDFYSTINLRFGFYLLNFELDTWLSTVLLAIPILKRVKINSYVLLFIVAATFSSPSLAVYVSRSAFHQNRSYNVQSLHAIPPYLCDHQKKLQHTLDQNLTTQPSVAIWYWWVGKETRSFNTKPYHKQTIHLTAFVFALISCDVGWCSQYTITHSVIEGGNVMCRWLSGRLKRRG
jgi:hypothetical protein